MNYIKIPFQEAVEKIKLHHNASKVIFDEVIDLNQNFSPYTFFPQIGTNLLSIKKISVLVKDLGIGGQWYNLIADFNFYDDSDITELLNLKIDDCDSGEINAGNFMNSDRKFLSPLGITDDMLGFNLWNKMETFYCLIDKQDFENNSKEGTLNGFIYFVWH